MKLTKFAIERPVTTTMLFIALAFFGIMAYMNVGVNMMPKVNSPSIMVTTVLPGATPEELEKNVTEKIEKEVSGLSNLKRVISYSMENVSTVQAEFRSSKNENEAMNEVKEKGYGGDASKHRTSVDTENKYCRCSCTLYRNEW